MGENSSRCTKGCATMKIMFYILFYLFLSFADPVFAASPTTGLDKDPSVDSAAVTAVADDHSAKETVDKDSDGTEPATGEVASSYVYDLKKLIIKSRENIKRVNEKIKEQSVVKRNQKREERAREYYQQGLQLQDEGKFDQAREYFEKAIRITEHPEMIKYIDQSALKLKAQETAIKRQERQQLRSLAQDKQVKMMDAATAYTQAVAYYKEKKYKEAKDMFTHVEELSENYKGTQSYLRIIDQNILESEASLNKQDKKELQRQREEAEKARQREKENWRKEIEAKEKSRKNQINAQADNVYTEAVKLYKTKKFMEAKKKFEEVEWVVPDYKASRDYIARADKDMAAEVAHVEQIKAKELALQQWEEEVAKRKKEALEKKEAEEKEKQRIKQLEEQDTFIYQAAIALFDKKSYDEALEKFTDVEKTLSGFRSTKAYIAKIAYIKEKEKQKQAQIAALEARRKAQEEERKKKQDNLIKEAETKRKVIQDEQIKREELKAKAAAAKRQQIEDARKKKEEEIKRAAEQIKNRTKDVKEPVKPLTVIVQIKHKPVPVPKPALTKEQEIDEARTIEALSERSALVLQKIGLLAADKRIAPVKKKMAKVEDMLNRIKMQKEIILRQLREDEDRERKRQQQIAHEQMMASIKDAYDEAIMYLRNQNYEQAQTAFMKIENDLPNYKMTRWYLGHIKENEHQAERQAVLERTQKEEDRLKALEVKREREAAIQRIALEARRRAEEERKRQLRAAQESEVQVLADKAGNLNDEILEASKVKDFGLAESKFTELEKVLETLEALKRTMTQEDRQDEQNKVKPVVKVFSQSPVEVPVIQVKRMKPITKSDEIAREQKKERRSEIKARQRDQQDHENRIRAERMSQEKARREEQDYTQDEVRRQKEEVYDHAVSLYKQKKFAAAKVIFDDLVIHNYPGSRSYLGKIDRYYEKAAAKSDAANERERSEFIAEQIRKQKMASVLAEKERARQRELTAQLERQRKIAEDEEQHQKIRIESMKMKEKDRQRLEMERSRQQLKRKNEEEQLEFRKLPIAKHEEQVKKEEPVKAIDPVKVDESQYEPEVPKDTKKDKEAAIANEKAKQEQILFSNKRKRFFEEQRSKEDKLKAEAIKKDELEKRKIQTEIALSYEEII